MKPFAWNLVCDRQKRFLFDSDANKEKRQYSSICQLKKACLLLEAGQILFNPPFPNEKIKVGISLLSQEEARVNTQTDASKYQTSKLFCVWIDLFLRSAYLKSYCSISFNSQLTISGAHVCAPASRFSFSGELCCSIILLTASRRNHIFFSGSIESCFVRYRPNRCMYCIGANLVPKEPHACTSCDKRAAWRATTKPFSNADYPLFCFCMFYHWKEHTPTWTGQNNPVPQSQLPTVAESSSRKSTGNPSTIPQTKSILWSPQHINLQLLWECTASSSLKCSNKKTVKCSTRWSSVQCALEMRLRVQMWSGHPVKCAPLMNYTRCVDDLIYFSTCFWCCEKILLWHSTF